jgi:hypothetical protein
MKLATGALALAGTVELTAAADRFNQRRSTYRQATLRAIALRRKLVLIAKRPAHSHAKRSRGS